MIVLQITSDYPPNPLWGMGWHVKFLSDGLKKKGIKIYIGTSNKRKEGNLITTSKKIDKLYLSNKSYEIFDNFRNFLIWQKYLGREIIKKGIEPDIIHCHNWMSWITAMEVKKKNPKSKVISTFHLLQKQYEKMIENPIPTYDKEIIDIEKEMILNSDYIIVQSQSQLNLIKSKYVSSKKNLKIIVVPSGIPFERDVFRKIQDKKLKNPFVDIVFIGRIEKDKGIYPTLEVFYKLAKKYSHIRFHILGKGSQLSALSRRFKSNRIIFHGYVDRKKLKRILESSHILCFPSLSESFGNSVIEAMIFGVVPIFSKGDAVPVLFKENLHGLNISLKTKKGKSYFSKGELEEKLNALLSNKSLINKFSRKIYKFSRNKYSIERMCEETLKVYKKTLK